MPIKQRKTTSVLLILLFTNNITKTLQKMKFKVSRRQVCHVMVKNNRITNSCGVGLHLTTEKEVQDFFLKLGVILIYAGYLEIKGCILLTMK